MDSGKTSAWLVALSITTFLGGFGMVVVAGPSQAQVAASPASQNPAARAVGSIKAIAGNVVSLTADSGSEIEVRVLESTRLLRAEPGQKSLKDATPIQVTDLQVGDRILVRGEPSSDPKALVARSVVVMKRGDIEQKQERDREDWHKRGVGGLVSAVDAPNNTITVSTTALGVGARTVAVHVSQGTVLRRYAPDSVRYDDAKPGTIGQIQPGDQLRARGTRSADGSEIAAEEIVSGSFRNIAGTVLSTDTAQKTILVTDLLTKEPVAVTVTAESQMHKLPPAMAQRIAARLRGENGMPANGVSATPGQPPAAPRSDGPPPGEAPGGPRPGGVTDFQQMLSRLPLATLADLQKGDAVMIVATHGAGSAVTLITLLSGVEPILTAPSSSAQAAFLSSWNLSTSVPDAGQ